MMSVLEDYLPFLFGDNCWAIIQNTNTLVYSMLKNITVIKKMLQNSHSQLLYYPSDLCKKCHYKKVEKIVS